MNDLDLVTPAPGIPEVRLTLLAVPSTVVLARELVRYALTNWGFSREVINDSTLVMSEIVTNAVAASHGAWSAGTRPPNSRSRARRP